MPADGTAAPALIRAYRCDRGSVAGEFTVTPEGYVRTVGRIAKPGIMTYRDASGKVTRELVPRSTLEDPEFLASLENKPLTIEHPPVMLNPENIAEYRKGMVLAPVSFADGYVQAPIQIDDADAITAMKAGKVELSPGYECDIDPTPGNDPDFGLYDAIQTKRYGGNHTALCDKARGGADIRLLRTDSAVEVEPECPAEPAAPSLPTEPPKMLSQAMKDTMKALGYSDDEVATCADDDAAHMMIRAGKKDDAKKDDAPAYSPEALKEIEALKAKVTAAESAATEARTALQMALEQHEMIGDDSIMDNPDLPADKASKMDSARADSLRTSRRQAFDRLQKKFNERAQMLAVAERHGVPRADSEKMGNHALLMKVGKIVDPTLPDDVTPLEVRGMLRALARATGGRMDSVVDPLAQRLHEQAHAADTSPVLPPIYTNR